MLCHHFACCPELIDYSQINSYECICISDDVINYIRDSLKWVPTYWECIDKKTCDINYYGKTIFVTDGITVLRQIICAWRELFYLAPKLITLKGNFVFSDCESESNGGYEEIHISQADIIKTLNSMVSICDKALMSGCYIVHFGI